MWHSLSTLVAGFRRVAEWWGLTAETSAIPGVAWICLGGRDRRRATDLVCRPHQGMKMGDPSVAALLERLRSADAQTAWEEFCVFQFS
jgi:hypothetical protein